MIPKDLDDVKNAICDLQKDIEHLKTRTDEKFIGIDGRLKSTDIRISELDKFHDRKLWQFLMTGFAGLITLIAVMLSMESKAEPIETISTTTQTVQTNGNMTTTVKQPPPSAISPQFSAGNGNDLCTIGIAGAVQTQILGISAGGTITEENCIRLKNAKFLYDSGMKVASVSLMCQDKRVFDAMMMAGTPCPYNGLIGDDAKIGWQNHEEKPYEIEQAEKITNEEAITYSGIGALGWLLLL